MIELVQMPQECFLAYRENLVPDYAEDKVRARGVVPGRSPAPVGG